MSSPNDPMRAGTQEGSEPPGGSVSGVPVASGTAFVPVPASRVPPRVTPQFRGRPPNRIGGKRAPKDGPPTRFGGTAFLLTVLCAALLFSSLPVISHATMSSPNPSSMGSAPSGLGIAQEANSTGQLPYLAGIAHRLTAGNTTDPSRGLANNASDRETLNAGMQPPGPHLPAGAMPTLVGESLTVPDRAIVESPVTFTESGLPAGTPWWVNLTFGPSFESTTANLSFVEPNGSYPYTVASGDLALGPQPASGELSVAGSAVTVLVTFGGSSFPVTFTESGLAGQLPWAVTVTGQPSVVSAAPTLSLSEPNGTYSFSVRSIGNLSYSANPASGRFTIDGSGIALAVTFAPDLYPVRFVESGLPAGTPLAVTLQGSLLVSSNGSLEWHEPNGSFLYTVGTVPGYSLVSSPTGPLAVNGQAVTVELTFVPAATGIYPFVGSSGGPGTPVGELLLLATALGGAVGIASWRIGNLRHSAASEAQSGPSVDSRPHP